MGGRVYIGLDVGTTGVLAAAFDDAGQPHAQHYREYRCTYPAPGWVEQDMEEVWAAICDTLLALTAALNAAGVTVACVGLSSQRGTFALLDDTKQPLAPAIVWNDNRAAEMEQVLGQRLSPQRYQAATGMPISGFWSVCKIMWLQQYRRDLTDRASWIVNGQEYFLYRLGAESLETDPASQTLSGMLDIATLSWSREVCEAAGIDMSLLPPMGAPGTHVGNVTPAAASQTGLPVGTPLCRGAGDQQCAAVGAGVVRQGRAEITMGTSAMMVAHLDNPALVNAHSVYLGGHGIPGKWDVEGGAFSIGNCLRWWRDNLHAPASGAEHSGSIYDAMVKQAMSAPPGSRGLIFHPFFAGQVTPHYDTQVRGGFFGLTLSHDHACMIRALLEGCACEIRMMGEALHTSLAGGIDTLMVTGGMARSAMFLQLLADIMNRPLTTLAYSECSALGAAMLGAVGIGVCGEVESAAEKFVRTGTVIEPSADRAVFDDVFGTFQDIFRINARSGLHQLIHGHHQRIHSLGHEGM